MVDLKEHLKEYQKREDILAHDLRSLTELLTDTQHNLRLSNDKVQHLTVNLFIGKIKHAPQNFYFIQIDVSA